jgi:hypothetical protein
MTTRIDWPKLVFWIAAILLVMVGWGLVLAFVGGFQ